MTELVLDASVLLDWFRTGRERHEGGAGRLRAEYEAGRMAVVVPSLVFLEVLNVAGRRWGWDEESLGELAAALDDLGFDVREPELPSVAAWVARGLTAYDAACVALAEQNGLDVVSGDDQILSIAGDIARPVTLRD